MMRTLFPLLAASLLTACSTSRPPGGIRGDREGEIAFGRELFAQHCNACHPGGEEGEGPSLLAELVLPGWFIKRTVRQGHGEMPAFTVEQIDDDGLEAIVAYVHDLRRRD
ncbi:MAG: cytochrome c [Candidatus Sumerlaeia bacterium]|nr:cytochrome c [Candidatus Sumerlaeia bacterium]